MDKIIDNLYLGDIQGASNLFLLKRVGITHILQVAAGFKPFFPGEFKYKVVNVLDMPYENLIKHFNTAIDFIKQAIKNGGSVLVHCFAGISRSASVVIAFLMQQHGMTMFDAMSHVRRRRPIIFPNPGFQRQLLDFERVLKQQKEQKMRQEMIQQQNSPMKQQQQQHQQTLLATPKFNKIGGGMQNNYIDTKYGSSSADKSGQVIIEQFQKMPINPLRQSAEAKSSYGQSRGRNQVVQYRNQETIKASNTVQSLDLNDYPQPHKPLMKQTESMRISNYNTKDNMIPAIPQSIYSSIAKKKNEASTESSYFNTFNKKEIDLYKDAFSKSVIGGVLQFSCSFCQFVLFTSADLLDHSLGLNSERRKIHQGPSKDRFVVNQNHIFGKTASDFGNMRELGIKCGSLFIKKKDWINEQDGSTGNILCPRKSCAVKIGTYCWQGQRCNTCGQFVQPSYQIFRNKVQTIGGFNASQSQQTIQSLNQQSPTKEQTQQQQNIGKDSGTVKNFSVDTYNKRKHTQRQKTSSTNIEEIMSKKHQTPNPTNDRQLRPKFISEKHSSPSGGGNGSHGLSGSHKKNKTHMQIIENSTAQKSTNKNNISNLYQALMIQQQQQQHKIGLVGQHIQGSPQKLNHRH